MIVVFLLVMMELHQLQCTRCSWKAGSRSTRLQKEDYILQLKLEMFTVNVVNDADYIGLLFILHKAFYN